MLTLVLALIAILLVIIIVRMIGNRGRKIIVAILVSILIAGAVVALISVIITHNEEREEAAKTQTKAMKEAKEQSRLENVISYLKPDYYSFSDVDYTYIVAVYNINDTDQKIIIKDTGGKLHLYKPFAGGYSPVNQDYSSENVFDHSNIYAEKHDSFAINGQKFSFIKVGFTFEQVVNSKVFKEADAQHKLWIENKYRACYEPKNSGVISYNCEF